MTQEEALAAAREDGYYGAATIEAREDTFGPYGVVWADERYRALNPDVVIEGE